MFFFYSYEALNFEIILSHNNLIFKFKKQV